MRQFFAVVLTFLFINNSLSQSINIDSVFSFTLSFRGLSINDLTIPVNFDKEKSIRNDSKLLLPVVKNLMQNPVRSDEFIDSVSDFATLELEELLRNKLYSLLKGNKYVTVMDGLRGISNESFTESLVKEISNISKGKMQQMLSDSDRIFLSKNLMSLISESEDDGADNNSDIFKFNIARDSSIAASHKTLDMLSRVNRIDLDPFIYCYGLYLQAVSNNMFDDNSEEEISNDHVGGNFLFYYDENGIRIAVGGKGRNTYTGHFDLIIDFGGDDNYSMNRETDNLFKNNFSCIIDLSGNDFYSASSNNTLAGAAFSSGFIFDKAGDDTYKGKNVSLGSAICGVGILYDEDGNDTYQANQFSTGAASFGIGVLVDRSGNDVYIANSYSQGFGMTGGVGAIVDNKGNDNYLIDASSLDIGRYEDHYISMSQGYGLGLRPYYAGGIGLIVEAEGNDFYSTDIFGQGGAYWYALGCIADKSGHDKYNSYQYAQGAGIHLAVGLLKDYDGWDFYTSDGVSQGCGHDFGFGYLRDVRGNDNYSAYSLSQGAGNANGIGILFDESGTDGYLTKEQANTRGYGNSRREFGSLGIFLDRSGEDYYSEPGPDSLINNNSMWGVMNDFYLKDLPSQASGNSYKVPLDSEKVYSPEQYFIMAKTIEPRFSLWQEYGFRKLAEDSLNTPSFIMKYLDSDDHRDGLVLRNLSLRIRETMGRFFTEKLQHYNTSMRAQSIFNPNEVAFICYLFGETKDPEGRHELLNLTFNENIRVRSSAVNALGKINTDTTDIEFTNKASERLREMANENSIFRLYNKDIAYAFKNYKNFDNIATLFKLLKNEYYGVRFTASSDLTFYKDEYYDFLNDNLIKEISSDPVSYISFLNSTIGLSNEKFRILFVRLLNLVSLSDEAIILNYIQLLRGKIAGNDNEEFKDWASDQIKILRTQTILKIK